MASLDVRLKQEEAALSAYKDYLSKQKDALEKSLNDRKDAYQEYFDTINQEYEDEEYEEKAELLMTNLQKLASSTTGQSELQRQKLQQQLEELEKERLKELRERAQEQVVSNIENQVSEINDKFDTLINSQQLLLQAMLDDTSDMEKFAAMYLSTTLAGATALQAENGINTLGTTFGSYFNGLSNMSVKEENGYVVINIGNETIQLSESEQKDIMDTVMRALRQSNSSMGLGR